MPKFKITSRGGTTLTKIDATLTGTYSGIVEGKTITQNAFKEMQFKDGVATLEDWDPINPVGGLTAASSLMLTIAAAPSLSQSFYKQTQEQFKLTLVIEKDPKGGKDLFVLEGLPNSVIIILTKEPRTKEEQEARVQDIKLVLQDSLKAKLARKK